MPSRSAIDPAGAAELAAAEVAAAVATGPVAAVAAVQLEGALEVPVLGDLVGQRLRFPSGRS